MNNGGMGRRGFWIPARAPPAQGRGRLAGMTVEKKTLEGMTITTVVPTGTRPRHQGKEPGPRKGIRYVETAASLSRSRIFASLRDASSGTTWKLPTTETSLRSLRLCALCVMDRKCRKESTFRGFGGFRGHSRIGHSGKRAALNRNPGMDHTTVAWIDVVSGFRLALPGSGPGSLGRNDEPGADTIMPFRVFPCFPWLLQFFQWDPVDSMAIPHSGHGKRSGFALRPRRHYNPPALLLAAPRGAGG